tara:strand:- start:24 stop:464 length:441 start_codon:yes stop_codon:yes gene_type:complete
MAFVLGLNAKMYREASGTWYEFDNCQNVTLNLDKATSDVTTRGGNGWRQSVATLRNGSVSFTMVYDTADTNFTAVMDAFLADTAAASTIKFGIYDGDRTTTGTQGLEADFTVTGFTINEGLEDAMTVDVTIETAYSSTAPDWVTIS